MRKFAKILSAVFCLPVWLVAVGVFCNQPATAQDSTTVHKNYTVKQDEGISSLLLRYRRYNAVKDFAEGYRIQISYTNVRDEVYKSKAAMYVQFPELSSYVEYEQPYYKLRLGDFKTRLQATHYLQEIIVLYPGAFIVKDRIKNK